MAPTATTLSTALWAGDLVAGGRLRSRSIEQLPGSPVSSPPYNFLAAFRVVHARPTAEVL